MSAADMKSTEHKRVRYQKQNQSDTLTVPQLRQLRKTETRSGRAKSHGILREKQRNRRQQFRDWMKGMRG